MRKGLRALLAVGLTTAGLLVLPTLSLAEDVTAAAPATAPAAPASKLVGADVAFILVSAALVADDPGLGLFYGGMVRRKRPGHFQQSLFSWVVPQWILFGYSLAFSKSNPFIGGFDFIA